MFERQDWNAKTGTPTNGPKGKKQHTSRDLHFRWHRMLAVQEYRGTGWHDGALGIDFVKSMDGRKANGKKAQFRNSDSSVRDAYMQ